MIRNMRILIVDNQSRARQSLQALLNTWYPNAEVREAANGLEAVQLAEEFTPHLILMDARMPSLNGIEATKLIRQKKPQITIIVLSMYSEFETQALSAGADAFINKSDLPERLRETLMDVTNKNSWK